MTAPTPTTWTGARATDIATHARELADEKAKLKAHMDARRAAHEAAMAMPRRWA
jgi:hypothetical protein